MTIWNVMKTYRDDDVYFQVIPYDVNVIRTLFHMEKGGWQVVKFMKYSRWTQMGAYKLANKKNKKRKIENI